MPMYRRRHARSEDRNHILGGVFLAGLHVERTDFRDADCTGSGLPTSLTNRKQPRFAKSLDDGSALSFDCLGFGPARVAEHVPENRRLGHFALRYARHGPASGFLVVFVVAVADRPAIASTTPWP